MRGIVTHIKMHSKGPNGTIQGSDGRFYPFISTHILPGNVLKKGSNVEFETIPLKKGGIGTIKIRVIEPAKTESANTVPKKALNNKSNTISRNGLTGETIAALELLYENGDYAAYLQSDCFRNVTPDRIPIPQLEQALTCAKRLLRPDDPEPVILNCFQRKLLEIADCAECVRALKPFADHQDLVNACHESMLALPTVENLVYKRMNRVCNCDGNNSSYTGLTKYFVACENSIFPYLFLIRIFAAASVKSIKTCIEDYIRSIKGMSRETMTGLSGVDKLILLPQLIHLIHRYQLPWDQLGQALQTNIISVFISFGEIDALKNTLNMVHAAPDSVAQRTVDLVEHYDAWSAESFAAFTQANVSRPLLHRICALIWDQQGKEACLSDAFLRLLSWMIGFDADALDEAIRTKYSYEFVKLQKQLSLLESLPRVLLMLEHDSYMFNLAAYISLQVSSGISAARLESVSDTCRDALDRWEDVAQSFYEQQTHTFIQASGNLDAEFVRLSAMFRQDFSHFVQIQEIYADKVVSRAALEGKSGDELEQLLKTLYSQQAYGAYCNAYQQITMMGITAKCGMQEPYVESLLQLHRFDRAIAFLNEENLLAPEHQKELIRRTICENFAVYGITEEAFGIFSNDFSVEKATKLLIGEISSTTRGFAAVAALIAVYAYADDLIKAMYLYSMFQGRGECGYTKIYSHFRSRCNNAQIRHKLENNHYNVIEIAFRSLSVDDLIDFLQWAGRVKVIAFKEYQPAHVYDWHFNRLLENPTHFTHWNRFYAHLVQHSDVTAWMVCVCNSVLSQKFHVTDTQNIYTAVDLVLNNANEKSIPINFLEIACSYIMTSGNIHLCKKMYEQLKQENVCNKVTDRNPWTGSRPRVLEVFNRYCIDNLRETGNPLYNNLLKLLWKKSGNSGLHELADLSVSRSLLFNKICQNYLNGTNFGEMVTLLNSDSWQDLTFEESEMLALLKMVYSDNTMLLHSDPVLYKDEDELQRVKRDCVDVVKNYPNLKEGLHGFDQSANSVEHKLVVYAHIFGICYSRDIYDEYYLNTIRFDNERMQRAYCIFQSKAYAAQLRLDPSYYYFFFRWRYLKRYIMEKVLFGKQAEDLAIIADMESMQHTQYVLETDYLPFKQDVNTFYGYEEIPLDVRNFFLVALSNGKIRHFLERHANVLAGLREDQKVVTRALIRRVDYREANRGVFGVFMQDIRLGNMETALSVAEAVSDCAVITLNAIGKCPDRTQACDFLDTLAVQSTTIECFETISAKINDTQFAAYEPLLVPMLCCCELDFHIYRRLRLQQINGKKRIRTDRYLRFLKFLQKYDPFAHNVSVYLQALTACMEGRRDVVAKIISQNDIMIGIPEEWKKEAAKIQAYAAGTDDAPFLPERSIGDSSRISRGQEIEFKFTKALIHAFDTQWEAVSDNLMHEVLSRFASETENICSRIKAGLLILVNYQKMAVKLRESDLPHTKMQLSFRIGMLALESTDVISDDLKLTIAAELFDVRNSLESEQRFALYTQFTAVLNEQISFAAWCENQVMIERFVRVIQNDTTFESLQQRVLIPGLDLYKPKCSLEERFAELAELAGACYGPKSVYEEKVRGAIEREMQFIENGPRLQVRIVNENDHVTDDTVYFQIENSGSNTVFLDASNCTVIVSTQGSGTGQVVPMTDICELRPNYVTGGRCPVSVDEKGCMVSVSIQIGNRLICRTEKMLMKAPPPEQVRVHAAIAYNVDFAVDDEEALFGRETEKLLLKYAIPRGKTVIYGPSRIGKTSLLNWVHKSYAASQKNVITVLMGRETNRINEYTRHAVKNTPLQYDDVSMTEYLLIDSILAAFEEAGRFGGGKARMTEDIKSRIQQILRDESKCVRIRHSNLNELLQDEGLELWILLDEFQQVVEKWTPDIGGEFVDACQQLTNHSNIKLILCGSDDLLKHMVLEDNSVWRKLFPTSCRIPVGPLDEEPFADMIEKDKIVASTGLRYSREALATLYKYTGGVALYGKQICNSILKDIAANSACFASRDIVYPSDIAHATQRLLKQQDTELNTKVSEGIRDIYVAVTKNLDDETDMQYLYYIARWLADHPDKNGFPVTEFIDHPLCCTREELLDSLRVAVERRIIRNDSSDTETPVYVFNTLFYYYAFRGKASQSLNEDKIFVRNTLVDSENTKRNMLTVQEIVNETQKALSEGVLNGTISNEQLNKARDLLGNNTWNTINNQGGSIEYNKDVGTVNKATVHINVQSITNTLNGILAAGNDSKKLLSGIQALPRLDSYLPQLTEGGEPQEISEEHLSRAMDNYVADMEESLEEATQQDDSRRIEKRPDWEILNMKKTEYFEFLKQYKVSDFFINSLRLADQLDCLFKMGSIDGSKDIIDYSPVTIMYCKLVEGMLKEYHITAYSRCFDSIDTDLKRKKGKIPWGQVPDIPEQQRQRLTIGSFEHPLVYEEDAIKLLVEYTEKPEAMWKEHKKMITAVKGIRNPSAHGSKGHRITVEQKNKLTQMLLTDGGIRRLVEIVSDT